MAKNEHEKPRSLEIAERGIKKSSDFRDFMSALMSDVVAGRLTPSQGNAKCNAVGKLLKTAGRIARPGEGDRHGG